MTAASDAAAVAAMLPIDHPLAQLARMRLEQAVREELPLLHFQTTHRLRDAAVDPDAAGAIDTIVRGGSGNPHGPDVYAIEVGSEEWERRVNAYRAAQSHAARRDVVENGGGVDA